MINLSLNENEANALLNLLDAAQKHLGVRGSKEVTVFLLKLEEAAKEAAAKAQADVPKPDIVEDVAL